VMRTQSRLLPIELTQFKAMGNRTTAYLFAFEFSRDINYRVENGGLTVRVSRVQVPPSLPIFSIVVLNKLILIP